MKLQYSVAWAVAPAAELQQEYQMCPHFGQVRERKARQAASSLMQPMLHSAYSEAPQWTPARLTRIVIITFLSGVIAGMVLLAHFNGFKPAQRSALSSYLLSIGGSACR